MFRRLIATVLCITMIMSTASAVGLSARDISAARESVQFFDTEGNTIRMTSNTSDNGEFEINTHVNGVLVETCIGQTGKSTFTSIRYLSEADANTNSGITSGRRMGPVVHEVNVSDIIEEIPSISPMAATGLTTLGTMVYSKSGISYSIKVTMETTYYSDAKYQVKNYVGSLAGLVTALISAMNLPTGVVLTYLQSLALGGVITLVEESITKAFSSTLRCKETDEKIIGVNTANSKQTGYVEGIYYYITSNEQYGKEYTDGFTHKDWRKDALGRMLFWRTIGIEYTPTAWIDGG